MRCYTFRGRELCHRHYSPHFKFRLSASVGHFLPTFAFFPYVIPNHHIGISDSPCDDQALNVEPWMSNKVGFEFQFWCFRIVFQPAAVLSPAT